MEFGNLNVAAVRLVAVARLRKQFAHARAQSLTQAFAALPSNNSQAGEGTHDHPATGSARAWDEQTRADPGKAHGLRPRTCRLAATLLSGYRGRAHPSVSSGSV